MAAYVIFFASIVLMLIVARGSAFLETKLDVGDRLSDTAFIIALVLALIALVSGIVSLCNLFL